MKRFRRYAALILAVVMLFMSSSFTLAVDLEVKSYHNDCHVAYWHDGYKPCGHEIGHTYCDDEICHRANADKVMAFDWGIAYFHYGYEADLLERGFCIGRSSDQPDFTNLETELSQTGTFTFDDGMIAIIYTHTSEDSYYFDCALDEIIREQSTLVMERVAVMHGIKNDISDYLNLLEFLNACRHQLEQVDFYFVRYTTHPDICGQAHLWRQVQRCRCGFVMISYVYAGREHLWSLGAASCTERCLICREANHIGCTWVDGRDVCRQVCSRCGASGSTIPCNWVIDWNGAWCARCGRIRPGGFSDDEPAIYEENELEIVHQ